jgi:hypothetical protein
MLAYKFLSDGGTGLLSGFRWPVGEWVSVEGELVPARSGVHACRTGDLARWLDDELWAVELDGELLEAGCFVLARRGRLVARVERWTPAVAAEFARVAVERRADLPGLVDDAHRWDWDPPSTAYMAAHALGREAEARGEDYAAVFDEERRWQGEWLAERLGLATTR